MHHFLLFYAPFFIVVLALAASFFITMKSTSYEE